MITLLLALQAIALQPVSDTPRTVRIDVVLYQGDPSGKLQDRKKLISPQLITLDQQTAVISQEQQALFLRPEESSVTDSELAFILKPETVGTRISLTPHALKNGDVILTGSIKTNEIIAHSNEIQQKVERDVRVTITCKPNETVTVPLYNPSDYTEKTKVAGMPDIVTATKPFTGKEVWVELKVYEQKPEK
jgi:hypothetical protein